MAIPDLDLAGGFEEDRGRCFELCFTSICESRAELGSEGASSEFSFVGDVDDEDERFFSAFCSALKRASAKISATKSLVREPPAADWPDSGAPPEVGGCSVSGMKSS